MMDELIGPESKLSFSDFSLLTFATQFHSFLMIRTLSFSMCFEWSNSASLLILSFIVSQHKRNPYARMLVVRACADCHHHSFRLSRAAPLRNNTKGAKFTISSIWDVTLPDRASNYRLSAGARAYQFPLHGSRMYAYEYLPRNSICAQPAVA